MTVKQLKMWSRETVRRNRIEPAETENLSNSQKCLITLHIVGWVIICSVCDLSICILVVSHFAFDGRTVVLITPARGHCLLLRFINT